MVIYVRWRQMDIAWREPHHDPLELAQDYERKVVAARRRQVAYPYEIIRMLAGAVDGLAEGDDETSPSRIPRGTFSFKIKLKEFQGTGPESM